jgi:diguanylate cyclase (GGDEF)-like protein
VSVLDRILFTQNFVSVGAVTTLVLAAMISERERVASHLQRFQAAASALAAERTALGRIATAIAREREPEHVLALVARHAAGLLGGTSGAIEQIDGPTSTTVATWTDHGVDPGPERISTTVVSGQHEWGTLVVSGMPTGEPPIGREELIDRLADLAGLAISTAQARARLMTEATTDSLTGLFNQRAFKRRLADEIARSERYQHPLALILIDLDAFKAINDAEGHLTGDLVLKEVARRVKAAVRLDALVARLGGDELAVLVPECDAEGGYLAAERVRHAVSSMPIGTRSQVTISAGIAALAPGGSYEDIIKATDAALYAAKRLGGNGSVQFTADLELGGALSPENLSKAPADAARSA